MKLPVMNSNASEEVHFLYTDRYIPELADATTGIGISLQVTLAERNESQNYINANCHGLADCNGTETCANLLARGQTANLCAHHRFRVRSYYIEQGNPDNGDHQQAIVRDDGVANSCLGHYRTNNCDPPLP